MTWIDDLAGLAGMRAGVREVDPDFI